MIVAVSDWMSDQIGDMIELVRKKGRTAQPSRYIGRTK